MLTKNLNNKTMKRTIILTVLFLTFLFKTSATDATLNLIPAPYKLIMKDGVCKLSNSCCIRYDAKSDSLKSIAEFVQQYLSAAGCSAVSINASQVCASQVTLRIIKTDTLGKEGYLMNIHAKGVDIMASTCHGLFYGIQSLRQLTAVYKGNIPCAQIYDKPRFVWRGMHLDVCRHFMPTEFVKKYIDYIAMHKMNTFHWHLTDDQGWRIEIKKYPELTANAAWRKSTVIGHHNDRPWKYDTIRYGGFYTQEEIKEIVAYATARYVNVVPEIELPGHAQAAISAYPWLGCRPDTIIDVRRQWGVSTFIFNVNDSVFSFLENVMDEVLTLFPSPYIHVGGDEALKDQWIASPYIQAKIKELGLKDEHALQSWFIQRMEKYINSKGRKIIGWDEILEGGLAPNAAVMSWRGMRGGIEAAKQKHYVVMTPGSNCYFDSYQGFYKEEPLAIGGFLTQEEVYNFEPIPRDLTIEEQKYILGAQGNVWTEYILNGAHVEYMIFPRMTALSEVLWTPAELKSWSSFSKRMALVVKWHKGLGINVRDKGICE